MKNSISILRNYKGLPKEIYILCIARIVNCMGNFVYPLLSIILTQKSGFTSAKAGTFITICAVLQAPSLILGGKLTDILGRKKIIIIFQTIGAISYIFCGFLKTGTIIPFIMIASVCYAIASPAYDALIADVTVPENRKGSYSLLYMGMNIGASIAPVLGGMLYKNHLSVIFIGDAVTTILSAVLINIYVKESFKDIKNKHSSQSELEKEQEGSAISVLLKRPVILYFSLIFLLYSFSYAQWSFMLPLQMAHLFKENGAKFYGLVAGMNGLVVIFCTPIITNLIHKVTSLKSIAIGGIFYAVSFGIFGHISVLFMFFVSITIMTFGEIMISINEGTFIANHTPSSHRGRLNSILPVISGTGYAFGPMIMGKNLQKLGFSSAWTIVSLLVFTGAMCFLILNRFDIKLIKRSKVMGNN